MRLLTTTAVSIATPHCDDHRARKALTMLTEPDMQARYVAATLKVIDAELRNADTSACNKRALSALAAGAARTAARLADGLELRTGAMACPVDPPMAPVRTSNVIPFNR
jgi:hypothetical protein